MTLNLNDEQLEALAEVTELAIGDQCAYLSIGDPVLDYDDEWPEVAKRKAANFRHMRDLSRQLGWPADVDRWEALAKRFEESAAQYEDKRDHDPFDPADAYDEKENDE